MIDIDSRVVERLHARADRAAPAIGNLRAAAVARGGTIRRRRVTAGSAGLLVGGRGHRRGAGRTRVAGRWCRGGRRGSRPAGRGRSTGGRPGGRQHRADHAPGAHRSPTAAEQPGSVGTDPAVLHFDAYLDQVDAAESKWRSGPGYEGVTVTVSGADGGPQLDLYIGPDPDVVAAALPWPGPVLLLDDGTASPLYDEGSPEQTRVDGRPATIQSVAESDLDDLDRADLPPGAQIAGIDLSSAVRNGETWVLRWEPVAGLHAVAQARAADRSLAFDLAEALRLDRSQRCPMPLRLAEVPAGAAWTGCRTAIGHGPAGSMNWMRSSIELTGPDGDEILVYAEDVASAAHPGDAEIVPNRTVAGYPAWWSTESPAGLYVPEFGPAAVFVDGASEATATQLVEDLTVEGDLDRPGSWPDRAVG